jgi:anti-sigma B factor antagonist
MKDRQFSIEQESHGEHVAILALHGDVDIYAAPAFKEALLDVIEAGWDNIIVDLTGAPFIDSTGLGVLVSGAKRAKRHCLAIVCDDETTLNLFEIVGFDRLFAVYRSRVAAYDALALDGFRTSPRSD